MNTGARLAAAALLRGTALAVLAQAVAWLISAVTGGEDANIGAGLLAFGVTVVVSGLWGLRDGRRRSSGVRDGVLTWILAGIVHGLVSIAFIQLAAVRGGDGLDAAVAVSDLVLVGPMLAALVAVPGAAAVALQSSGSPAPDVG